MVTPHFPGEGEAGSERVEALARIPLLVRAARRFRVPARRSGRSSSADQPPPHRWTAAYRLVDWATQLLLGGVALLLVTFRHQAPSQWPWIVAGHLFLMAAVHGLVTAVARGSANPAVRFLREAYPILFYTLFFRETELVNRTVGNPRLDPHFLVLEHQLFGTQPSVALMNALPQLWVSEILYASYFSYYVMVAGLGLWLLWRNRAAFHHFISVVTFVFYGCYVFYMAVPVIGPRLLFRPSPEREWYAATYAGLPPPAYPDAVQHGPFYHLMAFIYRHFEAMSAAFPSSHVAVAVTTLWFSWRYARPIRWVHAVMVVLLCVSTVYCHYHYAVDVPAGVLAALMLIPLGNWLYLRCDLAGGRTADIGSDPLPPGLRPPSAFE
jgi:membrane-associated phospholipid phosphatase